MAGKKDKTHRADVKRLTDEQLAAEVSDLRAKLYSLRTQTVTEKVEDHSQFKAHKRNIARLMTEQTARRHKAAPKSAPKAAAVSAAKPTPTKKPAAKSAAKSASKSKSTAVTK